MVIFVEILSRGRVRARHRLERFPATLGRGYDNDVILDDPRVSAHHARIEQDAEGKLSLVDLGTTNGTFLLGRRIERAPLPCSEIVLGATALRLCDPSSPVPATVLLRALAEPPTPWWRFAAAFVAASLLFLLNIELSHSFAIDVSDKASDYLIIWLVLTGWATLWAFASWVVRRRFCFLAHLTIGTVAFAAAETFEPLERVVVFSLDAGRTWMTLQILGTLATVATVLFAHLGRVGSWQRRHKLGVALVVAAAVALAMGLSEMSKRSQFSNLPYFRGEMLPPSMRVAPARTSAAFFQEARAIQGEVDSLAKDR